MTNKFKEIKKGATHAQLAEIISLRDYMAMSIVGAILKEDLERAWQEAIGSMHKCVGTVNFSSIAFGAYSMADAMLEARKQ